jgi:hypothetical protein
MTVQELYDFIADEMIGEGKGSYEARFMDDHGNEHDVTELVAMEDGLDGGERVGRLVIR